MLKLLKYSFLSSIILFSCNSKSSHEHEEITDENLISAHEIHDESLDIREELMEVEKQLKDANIDYSELKEELKTWDKDIIEVPGFEHSHEDEVQRKYHVHNPMKEFTNEQHLEYQKVMHQEIVEIKMKFNEIMVGKTDLDEEDTSILEEVTDGI